MPTAPWSLICLVFAFVLFAIGAFLWPVSTDPYRIRVMSAGLMFLALAQLIGRMVR
jgi:hypothetical protein